MTYDGNFKNNLKIEEVVNWFAKFQMDLVVLYFDEPVNFMIFIFIFK
jgi:hypothetical protein